MPLMLLCSCSSVHTCFLSLFVLVRISVLVHISMSNNITNHSKNNTIVIAHD